MTDLSGKTIIITGASRGAGAAGVATLRPSGKRCCCRTSTGALRSLAEIEASGGRAVAQACDVADEAAVKALIERAVTEFGGLDVLVNAGLIDPIARIEDSDPDAWSQIVDVNLKGLLWDAPRDRAIAGAGPSSISPPEPPPGRLSWSHYCATKAAVLSLTKCGHKEHGDRGITVVGLSPGTVATEMQVQIKDSGINPVGCGPKRAYPRRVCGQGNHLVRPPPRHAGTVFDRDGRGRAAVGCAGGLVGTEPEDLYHRIVGAGDTLARTSRS